MQLFIFSFYIMFDLFIYPCRDQSSINPANPVKPEHLTLWLPDRQQHHLTALSYSSPPRFTTTTSASRFSTTTSSLTSCIFPLLMKKYGKLLWVTSVLVYWLGAFLITASRPPVLKPRPFSSPLAASSSWHSSSRQPSCWVFSIHPPCHAAWRQLQSGRGQGVTGSDGDGRGGNAAWLGVGNLRIF